MKKIILAFDSFKGSVSSSGIAEAAEKAIQEELLDCQTIRFPIADGGEGTTEALCSVLHAQKVSCWVHDPLMAPIEVSYGIVNNGSTAILEMASASGLPLVAPDRRNPMKTTTYGVGEIVADALKRGCRKFIVGLGGSATNDAGIGMLKALGISFFDDANNELEPIGENLIKIHRIDASQLSPALKESTFTIACDVSNPFYGKEGASYVYAPQKGATAEQVEALDKGLQHYAQVLKKCTAMDVSQLPGAGAAGGMGGGLLPFLHASLQSGIEVILKTLCFEELVQQADLILTGEGKLDSQTGMGKALDGILRVGIRYQVPVIALGGAVESVEALNEMGFTAVLSIQPCPVTLEKAMQPEFAKANIERTVRQVVRIIKQFNK